MVKSYVEKFKDPKWQKKRLEILERDKWTCQICTDKDSSLNVHHKWYVAGKDPWDYPGTCLVTLCDDCHSTEHEYKKEYTDILIAEMLGKGLFYLDLLEIASNINSMTIEEFNSVFKVRIPLWKRKLLEEMTE